MLVPFGPARVGGREMIDSEEKKAKPRVGARGDVAS